MIRFAMCLTVALLLLGTTANATSFNFGTDPFLGEDAPTTPGRQIVMNERFISFNPTTDVFVLDPSVFGLTDSLSFLSDLAANVPASGVNVVVLRDTPTPFAAGIAANLIAAQVSAPGPGFFIYFNSGLNLPRLVFSTDLSDPTADLKVLARLTNLSGQPGRDALPTFTSANFLFAPVPEPASVLMTAGGLLVAGVFALRRRLQ